MSGMPCQFCGAPLTAGPGSSCPNPNCLQFERRRIPDARAPLTGQVTTAVRDDQLARRRKDTRKAARVARRRNRRRS